jgi:hypothetical protein
LESRRIYLRVATLLRANHDPVKLDYPHSPLTVRLRGGVIESKLLFEAGLAYLTAFGGMNSHPQADIQKVGEYVNMLYLDALSMLPFMTGGRSGREMMTGERLAAVEEYRDMKRRMMKPDAGDTTRNS